MTNTWNNKKFKEIWYLLAPKKKNKLINKIKIKFIKFNLHDLIKKNCIRQLSIIISKTVLNFVHDYIFIIYFTKKRCYIHFSEALQNDVDVTERSSRIIIRVFNLKQSSKYNKLLLIILKKYKLIKFLLVNI